MIGIEAGPTSAEADVVRRERKSFKRNAHQTLPSHDRQLSAIAAAPGIRAAAAEIGDGIGLVRLAGGVSGQCAARRARDATRASSRARCGRGFGRGSLSPRCRR